MEAKEANFNFVKEGNLGIPFFQRSYVWREEHWKQFFNDLYESFESCKEHFLGSIILKRQKTVKSELLVIDGQQRLTTFSILIKVLYDILEDDKKPYFRDLLFAQYDRNKTRIQHSRLDREKFEKIILDLSSIDPSEKEGLSGCYNHFSKQIKGKNISKEKAFEFLRFIVESKMWVCVNLNSDEDEQKIFDSINSTGEKLSATDIVKNSLFDKAIEICGEEEAKKLYEDFWEAIFEKNEEEKKFWEITEKNGRTKSEMLLYIVALIERFFGIDKDNLSRLSLTYKQKIQELDSKEKCKELLSKIKDYANIYRDLPKIENATTFSYEDWEVRFFHIINVTKTTTVIPLVVFLKSLITKEDILKECLYLLEILILCNDKTKDYNRFFAKIIERIIEESTEEEKIPNCIQSEISEHYKINQNEIEEWLHCIKNPDATLILFWIEAWREHQQKEYKDKTLLQYVYTLEHLMPRKWYEHWKDIGVDEENANSLIYQIGNMTLLKGRLNSTLQNLDWKTKKDGNGKVKNYISKNADLLITKELLSNDKWTADDIKDRTKKFIADFRKIWNIDLLSDKS